MSDIGRFLIFATLLCTCINGDVYLHNPRGSNNRLKAANAERQNANRLFDSQNNAKGGYNVGELTTQSAQTEADYYEMRYFQSGAQPGEQSYLPIEWTQQHSCGTDELTCQIVIQMLCQPENVKTAPPNWRLRDGETEDTSQFTKPDNNENDAQKATRKTNDLNSDRGVHESWDWYNDCYQRERNPNLFTADQKLNTINLNGATYSSAIFTRQNTNGNRFGYECPEERDYVPYFGPSPWKDIAVLTDDSSTLCQLFTNNTFSGSHSLGVCGGTDGNRKQLHYRFNNPTSCNASGFVWYLVYNYLEKVPSYTSETACLAAVAGPSMAHMWAVPWDAENLLRKKCVVQLPKPECLQAPWDRSNHLGNTVNGRAPRYNWTLPHFPSGSTQRCVLRVRYNISSMDYDQLRTDASSNGKLSPVRDNPKIAIGPGFPVLQFATDANQVGRVFEDRSHVFRLVQRPKGASGKKIFNLNVRGKRGNIVQAYPAVEYDFIPTFLPVTNNDLVHIQWTGSNSHVGDGQGQANTDRNNIVQVVGYGVNYPLVMPNNTLSMWSGTTVAWTPFYDITAANSSTPLSSENLVVAFATGGQYWCLAGSTCPSFVTSSMVAPKDANANLNPTIDQASPSFTGALLSFSPGNYSYISSRNNNFSNRAQKGVILVSSSASQPVVSSNSCIKFCALFLSIILYHL